METKKRDVLIYKFPVLPPDKKRDEPKSELSAEEMVAKAMENNTRQVRWIWASNKDTSGFVTESGTKVLPRNGVPRGQVFVFLE